MVCLSIPVLVGDGMMAPVLPEGYLGPLVFWIRLVFPERPSRAQHPDTTSALAAQTNMHGATDDAQPGER